ncbi:CPBP family intramembrane metalloprotease [Robertkochia solimangrovi]|nr:CPBP family intramembrane metalloprotease [Robertkochia solimangrovi]
MASWLLLYFFRHEGLQVLGICPLRQRSTEFAVGLTFIFLLKSMFIIIDSMVYAIDWKLNPAIDYMHTSRSFLYHLRSALTEDLVFRGALFYLLLQKLGMHTAILISAVVFGMYHWVSYGVIGDGIVVLIYVLVTTGLTGYIWAFTYVKTGSVLMSFGFHAGWNFFNTLFYDSEPYGNLLFLDSTRRSLSGTYGTLYAIFIGIAPAIFTLIFVKWWVKFKSISEEESPM